MSAAVAVFGIALLAALLYAVAQKRPWNGRYPDFID